MGIFRRAPACSRLGLLARLLDGEAADGVADRDFLERCFHKLLINFAWWVNRVDRHGLNVFEGGFLGLDNITVINRSEPLADGATLEQADGTSWMAMYCLNLLGLALELAKEDPVYEDVATKFFEHFVYISGAMKKMGGRDYQLWDEEDGFFYDVLRYPDGRFHKFEVRSLVGLIPLFAIEVVEEEADTMFSGDVDWFIRTAATWWGRAVSPRRGTAARATCCRSSIALSSRGAAADLGSVEFLSDAGLRSPSKHHKDHPFVFGGAEVRYEPAESDVKIKGGNSNWRGPVWFPTTFLLIESLRKFDRANESRLRIRTAASPDVELTPREMARELADRMIGLFTKDANGRRRLYGGLQKFQEDPHWRDYLLFYEHFDGDTGRASGRTTRPGWTGLVADLIDEWRRWGARW